MTNAARGFPYTWTAVIRDDVGALADASDLTLMLTDPEGADVAGFPVAVPPIIHDSTGSYHYVWDIPALAVQGTYVADWAGTVGGLAVGGSDSVDVVVSGGSITPFVVYCTPTDVRTRLAGDIPNMGTEYDAVLAAKCDEVTADINRMVAQARGISGAWSFVADTTATERLFMAPAGNVRLLPIDDCVEITRVAIYSSTGSLVRTLTAGTDYLPTPVNGALPITGLLMISGAWSEMPYRIGVTMRPGYGLLLGPDVREAAAIEVVRSFIGDRAGQNDTIGMTPFGSIIVAKAFTSKLRQLVSDYSMGAGFMR